MRLLYGLTIGFLLTIFIPSSVYAATYYVSTSGNDSNNCTSTSTACRTISSGISRLSAGDTLYILGGTYTGTVSVSKSGTAGSYITISSYQNEKVIVDGGGNMGEYSSLFSISGNYIHLKNIEVTRGGMGLVITGSNNIVTGINSHNHISNGILVNKSGQNNIVEDSIVRDCCEINKNGAGGHWASGLSAARNPTGTIIRRNQVYNNWGEGLSAYGGANYTIIEDNIVYDNWAVNIYVQNSSNVLVRRNLVYRSPGHWDNIANPGGQAGIVDDNEPYDAQYGNSSNNTYLNNFAMGMNGNFVHWSGSIGLIGTLIANNTFVNTYTSRANVSIPGSHTNVRFLNNIVVQDDSRAIANFGSGITKSNNLWSKAPVSGANGQNDIIGNPLLARTGQTGPGQLGPLWFTLTSLSPAINKALVLSEVSTDYFGTSRGSSPDIGAHEYTGGPIPTLTPPVTPTPTTPSPTPTQPTTPTPSITHTPTPTPSLTHTPTPTPTPSPTPKVGDANGDNKVDEVDYAIWLSNYNYFSSGGVSIGDFNRDGKVNGIDYVLWLLNFGK